MKDPRLKYEIQGRFVWILLLFLLCDLGSQVTDL